ncbi:metalloregulator ArsR/SmtB family transcription factor [Specibacter sp. NPDC078709]|uniref:ArsR/SmtB family transcription factor n=1 Tax=unclassified Specibacter TaxID=3081321 RepID=UPI0034410D7A
MTTALTLKTDTAQLCCEPGGQPALSSAAAQESARILKALSDPNRLRLLSIVKAGDGGEACVCDLTEPLDLGQPTVSHHLKILVDAGLLEREKRGTWAYYSLVPGALERAAALITGL